METEGIFKGMVEDPIEDFSSTAKKKLVEVGDQIIELLDKSDLNLAQKYVLVDLLRNTYFELVMED